MSNGALLLGVRNQASAATVLENVAQDLSDALELHVLQPTFYKMALFALSYGMGPAIQATATRADAIRAYAVAAPDVPQNNVLVGVRGSALRAQDRGIHGEHVTAAGIGVSGLGQTGVYGESNSGFAGTGVRGEARGNGAGNEGVSGFALEGIGVRGSSVNGIGVWASGGASGLVARGTGGVAARFDGNVFVTGNLTASGNKSAAVPHPDGSHRQLYVLESTESYFEDFGQALLQDGYAAVAIDPEFAALVRADDYHVFLTPYGDCNGLYVSDRNSTGFTVHELQKGGSTLSFGYRILARRRDIKAGRLERVEYPEFPAPPEPPEPPMRPQPLPEPDLPVQE